MNHTKPVAACVTALAVVLTAAACGDSDSGTATTSSATTPAATSVSEDATAHNEADVMFAQMMIPHHAQAIEMSDMLLEKEDISEPVRTLAEEIKAAQGPEIDQLTTWLDQWGEPTEAPDDMPDHGMEGMMSEQDMQALTDAEGTVAARLFLTQMIAHHEGAVSMAQTEIDDGEFPEAVRLARTIIDTQQQEIDTMHELLTAL